MQPELNQHHSATLGRSNTTTTRMFTRVVYSLCAACLVCGCDAPLASFSSNLLVANRLERQTGLDLSEQTEAVDQLLEHLFGTPESPRWPKCLESDVRTKSLISLDYLAQAAGPVRSDQADQHFGLFREHCVFCHGLSGSGTGPTSSLLNPYPRDFRPGVFKFKTTGSGVKPTKADLRNTLVRGIPGTSMPTFSLLKSEELEILTDYVVYLAIRGEAERRLLTELALDMDLTDGQPFWKPDWESTRPADYLAGLELAEQITQKIALAWAQPESQDNLVLSESDGIQLTNASRELDPGAVARGRALFNGKIAACSSCHGTEGKGDGAVRNFDFWTKDWTDGLDPDDREAIRPLRKLGALKTRPISPRNLQLGVFRGGSDPEDIYLRIVNGIDGTPMPAAALKPINPQGLSENDVQDLVSFVLSLSQNTSLGGNP